MVTNIAVFLLGIFVGGFFTYVLIDFEEYEAFLIRQFASAYEYSDSLKDNKLVVILSQG